MKETWKFFMFYFIKYDRLEDILRVFIVILEYFFSCDKKREYMDTNKDLQNKGFGKLRNFLF
jgi:hypothetical protein